MISPNINLTKYMNQTDSMAEKVRIFRNVFGGIDNLHVQINFGTILPGNLAKFFSLICYQQDKFFDRTISAYKYKIISNNHIEENYYYSYALELFNRWLKALNEVHPIEGYTENNKELKRFLRSNYSFVFRNGGEMSITFQKGAPEGIESKIKETIVSLLEQELFIFEEILKGEKPLLRSSFSLTNKKTQEKDLSFEFVFLFNTFEYSIHTSFESDKLKEKIDQELKSHLKSYEEGKKKSEISDWRFNPTNIAFNTIHDFLEERINDLPKCFETEGSLKIKKRVKSYDFWNKELVLGKGSVTPEDLIELAHKSENLKMSYALIDFMTDLEAS